MERCSLWGGISIGVGGKGDYAGVARWHYRGGMPVGVVRVLVARWGGKDERQKTKDERGEVVGVLVETRPVLNCALRNVAVPGRYVVGGVGRGRQGDKGTRRKGEGEMRRGGGLGGSGGGDLGEGVAAGCECRRGRRQDFEAVARRLNREVTCIARVVVDPRFRGMGVAEKLVRRSLATCGTARVEALASLGRQLGFFEGAGMRRYDRPMPEESVRLVAALASEGMVAGDLGGMRVRGMSGFLRGEVVRFARATFGKRGAKTKDKRRKTKGGTLNAERGTMKGGLARALEVARRRVGSWPAYFLWQRRGCGLGRLARVPRVEGMREALTVFMTAGEKAAVVRGLRGVDPDLGVAIRRVVGLTTKARRREEEETRRQGDKETRGQGDKGTRGQGDKGRR